MILFDATYTFLNLPIRTGSQTCTHTLVLTQRVRMQAGWCKRSGRLLAVHGRGRSIVRVITAASR